MVKTTNYSMYIYRGYRALVKQFTHIFNSAFAQPTLRIRVSAYKRSTLFSCFQQLPEKLKTPLITTVTNE